MFFCIAYAFFWVIINLFYPTKVIGKKNLPKKQAAVLTCNHYSNLDSIMLDVKLKKRIRYLAKKELFKNKFNSAVLRSLGAFPIDRSKADVKAFKFALGALKDNKTLGIFPEGTRNKGEDDAEMQDIKAGAITFASKSGAPLIPAMIYRRGRIWRKNYIVIGEPFEIIAADRSRLTHEETEANAIRLKQTMTKLREDFDKQLQEKKDRKNKKRKKAGV